MIYTIKQGHHHSNIFNPNRLWVGYGVKTIDFSFQFLNNPCYKLGNEDDWDINKLFGISFGLNHHKDSFRLGWRPTNDDMISIHAYLYNYGKRYDKFLYAVNYNTEVDGRITICKNLAQIRTELFVRGNKIDDFTTFFFNGVSNWSFRLFPYFGGNTPATHDIHMAMTNDIKCEFKI